MLALRPQGTPKYLRCIPINLNLFYVINIFNRLVMPAKKWILHIKGRMNIRCSFLHVLGQVSTCPYNPIHSRHASIHRTLLPFIYNPNPCPPRWYKCISVATLFLRSAS